jgi:transposase
MTLHPRFIPDIPEETVRVAKAAFRKGNRYMQMRDELGTLYEDAQFGDLFPNVGRSAASPWRLALVTVMQFAENLTDRQAADAVRSRIDWKYALSLSLEDDGFDFSVLSEFRSRLVEHEAYRRLFDLMLTHFEKRELLKAGGKQRTDSTFILGQVRELNRLEFVGETLRAALNVLAEVAPAWLQGVIQEGWAERYSRPFNEWRLPQKDTERFALGEQIGRDGIHLLTQVYDLPREAGLAQLPAVEFLRRTWVYQYYHDNDQLRWRRSGNLPSSGQFGRSPYDPDTRFSASRGGFRWTGYRVHLTETCDDDAPHLITHVETTLANQNDVDTLPTIHQHLAERRRLPAQHLVDSGYTSGDLLVSSLNDYGIELMGPLRSDYSWQKKSQKGYDASYFKVDFERQLAICPQGKTSMSWFPRLDRFGKPVIHIQFLDSDCRACPARSLCTRSQKYGRQVVIRRDASYHAIQAARQRVTTEEFKTIYRLRAGIEGTISHAVNTLSMRRTRYRGFAKVDLQHWLTAAALNLGSVLRWLSDEPHSKPRTSAFSRLVAA